MFQASLTEILESHPVIPQANLPSGKVGIGLIPRNYNDSVDSWVEALRVAQHLGVQVLQLPSGYWAEDEPVKGAYQWQATHRFVEALDIVGVDFEVSQDIGGPFFHDKNMAPGHLQPIQLTDPNFAPAYVEYLTAYLQQFGSRVSRLLIHAEGAYAYFDANPSHLNAYLKLLDRVRASTQSRWPHLQIGVNIDPHNKPEILTAIAQHVDFVGFDIVQIEDMLEKPGDLDRVVNYILEHTDGKPITLACGWSSAAGLGGGDAAQSEFYQAVFAMLRSHRSRVQYVALGPPFDENRKLLAPAYEAQFSDLPDSFVTKIVDWITQLGLIRIDGSPKPAFTTIHSLIQDYYHSRGDAADTPKEP